MNFGKLKTLNKALFLVIIKQKCGLNSGFKLFACAVASANTFLICKNRFACVAKILLYKISQ